MTYAIKEKSIEINKIRVVYTETGPESGRVMLCVHGLLSNGRDYDILAQRAAQKGYRVLCLDLPGRGKTDWLPDVTLYSLPTYVGLCHAFVSEIVGPGVPYDWLGVSLGGMIGMAMSLDTQGTILERLILVDIGAEVPGPALDVVAKLAKSPVAYTTKEEAVAFLKFRCSAWGIRQESHWQHLITHNIHPGDDGRWHMHYDPRIGQALAESSQTVSFWEIWEAIKQPVLVLRGKQSRILPAEVLVQMEMRYHGSSMATVTFPDCGHVPNLMEEVQTDKILDWLR